MLAVEILWTDLKTSRASVSIRLVCALESTLRTTWSTIEILQRQSERLGGSHANTFSHVASFSQSLARTTRSLSVTSKVQRYFLSLPLHPLTSLNSSNPDPALSLLLLELLDASLETDDLIVRR
jgi:hypothetical protein